MYIHNRIAAFGQQHLNQRQRSAKVKAGFLYTVPLACPAHPPSSSLSIHLYLKCTAKLK